MGDPPPLRVDAAALTWEPAVVTVPPMPTIPPGGDPMSLMISAILPEMTAPLDAAVAATHAREERFAANLHTTRTAYQTTDQANQRQVNAVADTQLAPAAPVSSAGSGAGGQFGQMMGTAMQAASQIAQVPAQVMGMAAQAPQAVMQASQGAVQQIGQMTGQFGKSESGAGSSNPTGEVPEIPSADREPGDQTQPDDAAEDQEKDNERDGAAAGADTSERAPDVAAAQPPPHGLSSSARPDAVDM